ncbi:MAG TPA: amino acid--tRNA ligase-related protein, partial [Pseudoxanthomonas sp.]|nr:amino acid--tRNA ligase-related protein [Pseudoxanthomonas sp.]
MRTHFCGLIDEALIGQTVTLCGWTDVARNLGGLCFIDLRDHHGIVQVLVEPERIDAFKVAAGLGYEDVLQVEGVVRARESVNDRIPTGRVEVVAASITVLNQAQPLPFHAHENPGEEIRLKYRYLDLRRPDMQRMLRTRTRLVAALRQWLDARGFQDIETPILTKATPEGARDFLVPARMHPGEFYALPQSPQLFKQILMVAGFDRYFQIAPCFRDEAGRADRTLMFYQLDVEMSFVAQDDVLAAVSECVLAAAEAVTGVRPPAIERMTWRHAMDRYGV